MNKHTKKTLLLSILALILCCAMLAGTTFAWFTDSVKTDKNVIKAGTLDVALYHATESGNQEVDENTALFTDVTKWEPGMAACEVFTVKNEGNLALKYDFDFSGMICNNTLPDYLYVKTSSTPLTRAALTKDASAKQLSSFVFGNTPLGQLGRGNLGTTNVTSSDTIYVYVYWPANPITVEADGTLSSDDNVLNVAGESLTLSIALNATQAVEESDSFGNNYDAGAEFNPNAN